MLNRHESFLRVTLQVIIENGRSKVRKINSRIIALGPQTRGCRPATAQLCRRFHKAAARDDKGLCISADVNVNKLTHPEEGNSA